MGKKTDELEEDLARMRARVSDLSSALEALRSKVEQAPPKAERALSPPPSATLELPASSRDSKRRPALGRSDTQPLPGLPHSSKPPRR